MLVDVTEEMIREQLDRILNSAQFKSSRRCRSFLEYVVIQASSGSLDHLKERTIGIEVFGRNPDYDTNHDPIVRGTASEIRKRLAQYYQIARGDELRIELSAGSYLPDFHIPSPINQLPITAGPTIAPAVLEPNDFELKSIPFPPPGAPVSATRSRKWWFISCTVAAVVAVLSAAALYRNNSSLRTPVADQFWAPVLNSKGPVLLCVGQPTVFNLTGSLHSEVLGRPTNGSSKTKVLVDLSQIVSNSDRYLALGDAMCLSALTAFLAQRDHDYHVRGGGSTSFADLRENTTVLIGGFTNDWTMRLTEQLRFTFHQEENGDTIYVEDRLNPGKRTWQLTNFWPDWKMPVDYAIVARVLDPNTGKIVISAAGITQFGTAAAGEFLTQTSYLANALKQAPKNWQHESMEVVLATRVIDGTAGPPQVVATNFQ